MAPKLEGLRKALVAGPLQEITFFGASLRTLLNFGAIWDRLELFPLKTGHPSLFAIYFRMSIAIQAIKYESLCEL